MNYSRGETITFIANYVDGNSSPILNGISGAMIDVYRYTTSGTRVYNVQSGVLNQDTPTNRFFYGYTIPSNAVITNYVVDYYAKYSGINVQSSEVFGVSIPVSSTGINTGSVTVSGLVIDVSGTGIANAVVQVAPFIGMNVITSTSTDVSGNYVVYLDPGDYMLLASAQYYYPNSVAKTVTSGTTTFGSITLIAGAVGSLLISDTYQSVDPNTQTTIPLPNLKVSIYDSPSSASIDSALVSTRTDASGTFSLTLNPGDYIMLIDGPGPYNTVYKYAYDIEVDAAFATSATPNFRYKGTSAYNFLN